MISVSSLAGQTTEPGSDWPPLLRFTDQDFRQAEWTSICYSLDTNANGTAEGLSQSFSLAHLQRKYLAACDGCEWCVGAQRLGHACGSSGQAAVAAGPRSLTQWGCVVHAPDRHLKTMHASAPCPPLPAISFHLSTHHLARHGDTVTSLGSAISELTEPPLALPSWQRCEWEDRWIRRASEAEVPEEDPEA